MEAAKKSKYTHGEAFALMWYACECGHRERIWNSRDGVTPFGLDCPSCAKTSLRHIQWGLDEPSPEYALVKGQRYFADGTPDEAEQIMRHRIKMMKGTPYECDAETTQSLIHIARAGEDEFLPGWPITRRNGV